MDYNKAAADIRVFLLEAGEHALGLQKGIKCKYKAGEQAVTQADLDISRMATDKLSYWLNQDGHVLIDEESIDNIASPEEVFAATHYQWVLDPVDGTAGYALGRDRWGVSLGLLEDGVPVAGGFYLPAIGALMTIEEGKAVYTDIPSGDKRSVPEAAAMEINSQVFFESIFGFDYCWQGDASQNKVWLNTPESSLQGCYSAFMRQSAGMSFNRLFSIWDIAGAAAIARMSGYKVMSLENGSILEHFDPQYFKDTWKLRGDWVLVHPDNYNEIKAALTGG